MKYFCETRMSFLKICWRIADYLKTLSDPLSYSLAPRVPAAAEKRHRTPEKETMPSSQIQYSEKYYDDTYEYR